MSSALISNTNDKVAQGSKPALHGVWLRRLTGACLLLLATLSLHAQSTTNCTSFDDLKAFIAVNDSVEFDCDGTISFTDPISITHAVVIDGGSNRVTLSGNNITRLFSVAPGGSL